MQLYNLLNLFNQRPDLRSFLPQAPSESSSPAPTRNPTKAHTCEDCQPKAGDTYAPGTAPAPVPQDKSGLNQTPDGGYYYKRSARLDYQLNLQFNLASIMHAAEQIEDGETRSAEQLIAAGFGLHADFMAKGVQRVETNMQDEAGTAQQIRGREHSRARGKLGMAMRFAEADRGFAARMFQRTAADVRKSLKFDVQDGHRRATNRIALRFQMDTRFSFALAQRFNVQTQQVAEKQPDAVGPYVDNAGALAQSGTAEAMTAFFDAVEAYLDGSEARIMAQTEQFFDQAASDLGFEGALVEAAKAQLTGSIESFFGRVEDAIATLSARYESPAELPVEPSVPAQTIGSPDSEAAQVRSQLAVA